MARAARALGRWQAIAAMVVLGGFGAAGCHIDQELNPGGPGTTTTQVIKFENQYGEVFIRIADANQEFYLKSGQNRTVEVYSDEEITSFFVEIIVGSEGSGADLTKQSRRWSGYVSAGQQVTILHISRINVSD